MTPYEWLLEMRRGGRVERWHTYPLAAQNIGHHSWAVAMIVLTVRPDASAELVKAALFHDIGEHVTGDVPAQAKWRHLRLADALEEIETGYRAEWGIAVSLSPEENETLNWADRVEILFYALEERRRGNLEADLVFDRVIESFEGKVPPEGFPALIRRVKADYRNLTNHV